jgi:flagellar P-ring protein precursor FlgI
VNRPSREGLASPSFWITWLVPLIGLFAIALVSSAGAQETRVRDLVIAESGLPVRLMGYGLVTGLNGTGDRVTGNYGSRQTVQSIVNLLRRFDVDVPAEVLRTRNVAAVLVTAEVSPYLRPGGRFEVKVSSLGDAQSLRGGVLWMTPMVADAGGKPLAGAQGAVLVSTGGTNRIMMPVMTTARIPDGGVLEAEMVRPQFTADAKLLLRTPDIGTASRIAAVIDSAFGGRGNAVVEDPGSIKLTLKDTTAGLAAAMSKVRELAIRPPRAARVVIDGRDGTIVTGGDLTVGEAMVSHGGITLSVGASADTSTTRGDVRVPAGSTVRVIAAALHAVQTTAQEAAAIFEALREVGAISADVVVR